MVLWLIGDYDIKSLCSFLNTDDIVDNYAKVRIAILSQERAGQLLTFLVDFMDIFQLSQIYPLRCLHELDFL